MLVIYYLGLRLRLREDSETYDSMRMKNLDIFYHTDPIQKLNAIKQYELRLIFLM